MNSILITAACRSEITSSYVRLTGTKKTFSSTSKAIEHNPIFSDGHIYSLSDCRLSYGLGVSSGIEGNTKSRMTVSTPRNGRTSSAA